MRRTNILQDDDVVAERERLKAIQKLQAAMKARVARVPVVAEMQRRATEAKAEAQAAQRRLGAVCLRLPRRGIE